MDPILVGVTTTSRLSVVTTQTYTHRPNTDNWVYIVESPSLSQHKVTEERSSSHGPNFDKPISPSALTFAFQLVTRTDGQPAFVSLYRDFLIIQESDGRNWMRDRRAVVHVQSPFGPQWSSQ